MSRLQGPKFQDLRVRDGMVVSTQSGEGGPLAGAVATVDTGANTARITATRLALIGPFALAFKKGSQQTFLTIAAPTWAVVRVAGPSDQGAARQFAAMVNVAAQRAAAPPAPAPVVEKRRPLTALTGEQPKKFWDWAD